MSSAMPELAEQLILDGTKVGWYPERIAAWQRGERIAPAHCDIAMTRACNFSCHFCYASLQSSEGDKITKQHFFDFLSDAAEIGILGVSYISDGESTVVPWWADAVEYAREVGLKVGAGSNGAKLARPLLERTLKHLSFLRFNFSAGERRRYAAIMGTPQEMYDVVVQNVRDAMDIVRRDGLECTVNLQLVLHPVDGDQIIPFARLAAEIKPTYAIIKHCSDGAESELGVSYDGYAALEDDLHEAERIGREAGVRITVKWNRINSKCQRSYSRCFGPPFQIQVSGNGTVAPCGLKFNERYKALHLGSIVRQRFRDIWASDRYMEVMGYLASDQFDPRTRCAPGCLQDPTNAFLFEYVNGRVSLPTVPPPPHLEFI